MVKYGVRGKINVTMMKSIGKMKDMNSAFRSYLNKEKLYVSQAALGLVNARIIGVFRQANPTITFQKDLKEAIMEVMADGMPIHISQESQGAIS
jgi:hypothetical protein